MVVRYVVGKPEAVDASTVGCFFEHLAFNVPPGLLGRKCVSLPLMVPTVF